jgi:hypothetical protein
VEREREGESERARAERRIYSGDGLVRRDEVEKAAHHIAGVGLARMDAPGDEHDGLVLDGHG